MLLTTIVLLTLTSTLSLSPSLLIFGQGYTASQFTSQQRLFHQITSTTRTGTPPSISYEYDSPPSETLLQALSTASHVLITAPPPALLAPYPLPALLTPSSCPNLTSISFISTTSVYGDHSGAWVDESTPTQPNTPSAEKYVKSEDLLRSLGRLNVTVNIFRCAGIYGDGRSAADTILKRGAGNEQPRDDAKPLYTSRIHVKDIASAIETKMRMDWEGAVGGVTVFNLSDDEPSRRSDVFDFAAELLGVREGDWSGGGRSKSNKRVRNDKLRELVGRLEYPTFREGLTEIVKNMN